MEEDSRKTRSFASGGNSESAGKRARSVSESRSCFFRQDAEDGCCARGSAVLQQSIDVTSAAHPSLWPTDELAPPWRQGAHRGDASPVCEEALAGHGDCAKGGKIVCDFRFANFDLVLVRAFA